jgi:hypothetical protein
MLLLCLLLRHHDLKAVSIHCASADGIARNNIAERIFHTPCCRAKCLHSGGYEKAIDVISNCLLEVESMTNGEKHEYIFQKLLHSAESISEGGYLNCEYNLGVGVRQRKLYGVCHTCFQNVYQIGHTTLYEIRAQVKAGLTTTVAAQGKGDQDGCTSQRTNPAFIKKLCHLAEERGYMFEYNTLKTELAKLHPVEREAFMYNTRVMDEAMKLDMRNELAEMLDEELDVWMQEK